MTKTTLIALLGGACATALLVLGLGATAAVGERASSLAWMHPPAIIPKPMSGVRTKATEPVVAPVLAWDQPPAIIPKPSGTIRRKAVESTGRTLA